MQSISRMVSPQQQSPAMPEFESSSCSSQQSHPQPLFKQMTDKSSSDQKIEEQHPQRCSASLIKVHVAFLDGSFGDLLYFRKHHGSSIGQGAFGRVARVILASTHEEIAIKTIFHDFQYRNRELEFLCQLDHCNIAKLRFYYRTKIAEGEAPSASPNCGYLHLGLEAMPESVAAFSQRYDQRSLYTPLPAIKLIMYQLFRALAYLHNMNVCHRDIKPQNLLIDGRNGVVKLCDLGAMRRLDDGKSCISYVGTRPYRAPELLCGSTKYICTIDTWAAGCVFAELLQQHVLFPGTSAPNMLARILRVTGSPSLSQTEQFCNEVGLPIGGSCAQLCRHYVEPESLSSILPVHIPVGAISLLSQLLKFIPSERLNVCSALAHPWFNELHDRDGSLRARIRLPPLFDFTPQEMEYISVQAPELLQTIEECKASSIPEPKLESIPTSTSLAVPTDAQRTSSSQETPSPLAQSPSPPKPTLIKKDSCLDIPHEPAHSEPNHQDQVQQLQQQGVFDVNHQRVENADVPVQPCLLKTCRRTSRLSSYALLDPFELTLE